MIIRMIDMGNYNVTVRLTNNFFVQSPWRLGHRSYCGMFDFSCPQKTMSRPIKHLSTVLSTQSTVLVSDMSLQRCRQRKQNLGSHKLKTDKIGTVVKRQLIEQDTMFHGQWTKNSSYCVVYQSPRLLCR